MEKGEIELKSFYLGIFSLNYFTQGINQSMFTTIIPIYLLQLMGSVNSAEVASLMSLILLPFGVKFLYGMLSDKVSLKKLGRRKPWIIGPSFVAGFIWILLPFLLTAGNAMTLFMLLGIIIVIGVAMGDTAIDGLILDLYPKERLGRVQGICWGFRSVGIIAGGPLIVAIILLVGGNVGSVFIGLGFAMFIFSIFTLLVKEIEKEIDVDLIDNLKVIFGKIKNWKVYIFSLFMALVDGVIFVFIPLFIIIQWGLVGAAGATIDLIGDPTRPDLYAPQALVAFIVGLGVIAGAIIGGRIADLKSRKRSILYSLGLSSLSFLLFIIPTIWPVLLIFAFILGISSGWRNSAFSAVIGQESQLYPEMDSTYYATCNSFANLGTTIGLEITSLLFASLTGLGTYTIYIIIFLFMAIIVNLNYIPFSTMNPKDYEITLTEPK
jgi:PAT family beta-lactamase induction signal transducer AmpG